MRHAAWAVLLAVSCRPSQEPAPLEPERAKYPLPIFRPSTVGCPSEEKDRGLVHYQWLMHSTAHPEEVLAFYRERLPNARTKDAGEGWTFEYEPEGGRDRESVIVFVFKDEYEDPGCRSMFTLNLWVRPD